MIALVLALRHSIDNCSNSNRPFFELPKASLSKRGLVHNHSYENEFNLHVNGISFSYERMSTKTRFEKEAKGNSKMAYSHLHTFGV